MEKWEKSLNKFLKKWIKNEEVIGIIVCGSYVTGNPTKHSDIDLQIILKEGCEWRERGNKIVDGILIEYFANPPEKIIQYFEDDEKRRRKITAHMIYTGKIILDKNGQAKKLKKIAKKYLAKSFEKMPKNKIEIFKYHLWDMLDNLEEVYLRNNPDFYFVYNNFLGKLLEVYTEFIGYPDIHFNKVFRFLTDNQEIRKYNLPNFPDKRFKELFLNAIREREKNRMLNIFKTLIKHVHIKMGGFNIDGWELKSSSK